MGEELVAEPGEERGDVFVGGDEGGEAGFDFGGDAVAGAAFEVEGLVTEGFEAEDGAAARDGVHDAGEILAPSGGGVALGGFETFGGFGEIGFDQGGGAFGADLGGQFAEGGFEVRVGALGFVCGPGLGEQFGGDAEFFGEVFDADRLGDVRIHAGGQAGFAVAAHGIGGHGDDAGPGPFGVVLLEFPDGPGGGESVHLGHLAVHQDDVELGAGGDFEGFAAVGDEAGAVAQLFEHEQRQSLVDGMILGHENAEWRDGGGLGGPGFLGWIGGFGGGFGREQRFEALPERGGFGGARQGGVEGLPDAGGRLGEFPEGREQDEERGIPARHLPHGFGENAPGIGGDAGVDENELEGRLAVGGGIAEAAEGGGQLVLGFGGDAAGLEEEGEGLAAGGVGGEHEGAQTGVGFAGDGWGWGGWEGDFEGERAAGAGGASDDDFAAHHLNQTLGDGESETGAPEASGGGGIDLGEGGEEPGDVGGGDADAGVGDGKAQFGQVVEGGDGFDAQDDFAAVSEFDAVAEEVDEDLAEPAVVADEVPGGAGVEEGGDFEGAGVGPGGEQFDDAAGEGFEVEGFGLEGEALGLDFGEVEDFASRMP